MKKRYITQEGDTLASISKKLLGSDSSKNMKSILVASGISSNEVDDYFSTLDPHYPLETGDIYYYHDEINDSDQTNGLILPLFVGSVFLVALLGRKKK